MAIFKDFLSSATKDIFWFNSLINTTIACRREIEAVFLYLLYFGEVDGRQDLTMANVAPSNMQLVLLGAYRLGYRGGESTPYSFVLSLARH